MRPTLAYALSLAALAAAVLLRWLLDPVMGDTLPLVTLFGAVAAAVWFGGWQPAVVVGLLGYASCNYLFIPPRGSLRIYDSTAVVGLIAYLFTCALIIGFGESARRARNRASLRRELLQVTLRSIGDAVITTDNDGRATSLNAVAERLTGWKQEEAAGQPLDSVFRVVNEETKQPVENPVQRALREGVIVGLANHSMLIRKDGSECSIDDSAAPIRNNAGEISGCVLVFRDVTAQRTMERDRARQFLTARLLAAIVESSDDAIISKSLAGIIQSWNAAAERVFGYTAAQAIGQHISLVIPPERIAEEDQIVARLKTGQRVEHFETVRVRSDQRRILVSLTISPIKDATGTVVGASKIVRDITAQREAEERANAERTRMEDDLRKLAADLSTADRRKNEFLAMLAHELRNPLAPLANMLEVLQRAGGDPATVQRVYDTMARQLGQLVRLVDDLLDLNRISHDRLELRRSDVELAPIIRQAIEASRPLIDSAEHKLNLSLPVEPIHLLADPARLAQVFGNLLTNSAKYTPHGGRIELAVERRDSDVVVTVKDNGTGIPPDKQDSIFEMFTQVDRSLERAQGGLGIGLALVKRLVEMHGGSIEVRSAGEGQGSEFAVRLPTVAGTSLAPAAEQRAPVPPVSNRRILIADDNKDSAESLSMLLGITGNETFLAHDGVEAIAVADRERPDVMLVDIGMPRMNGHEVCRHVREQPYGRDITIIALTGWGQEEDRRRSLEAGFDGHLVKPVDHAALMELLSAVDTRAETKRT